MKNTFANKLVFKDYDFLSKYTKKNNVRATHQILAASIAKELNVKSVLDIGGGTTSFVCSLENRMTTAIVDISAESLRNVQAQRKIVGALPDIPIQDEGFQFVSALEVIEHIDPSIYEDSLLEISRVASCYVFITSPFMQDLSGAFVLCDKCGVVFQCEGHFRRFDLKKIENMQKYLGGLRDIYFIGPQLGCYFIVTIKVALKYFIRRFLQITFKKKYCHPPFTKCPVCEHEMITRYDEFLKTENLNVNAKWWKWRDNRNVSYQFGALFDKHMPYIQL